MNVVFDLYTSAQGKRGEQENPNIIRSFNINALSQSWVIFPSQFVIAIKFGSTTIFRWDTFYQYALVCT